MPKPANYYASTAQIPDYVESTITSFSRHDRFNFCDALIAAIRDRRWSPDNQTFNINYYTDTWLSNQSVDTFKSLHKWLSNELL